MNSLSRRKFLSKSALSLAAAGASVAVSTNVWAQSKGSNDDIRIGVIGLGRKGIHHMTNFNNAKGARVVALCDVDQSYLDKNAQVLRELGQKVKTYKDVRDLLDDKEIDAVVIATPNHWHTLMMIWACQAGKDIYVEKPVCHDIWEGQRMLEAEEKYGRIIQGGTQNRSNAAFREGLAYLRAGNLGEIQWMHAIDYKRRKSIGKVRGPQLIPSNLDYDLYCGPASLSPLGRKQLHYDWHWQWETGNADLGNIGAHTVDNIRHIMGDDLQPTRVMSLGGRFVHDDDGQTPNVHLAAFDYGKFPVFAETRGLTHKPGSAQMDHLRGSRQSCVVQCEGGYMTLGDGAMAFSNDKKRLKGFSGNGVVAHVDNFIDAVKNQKASLLNCPLKVAVQAGEMFHMGNLSYRSGRPATPQEIGDVLSASEAGTAAFESIQALLGRHEVDLSKDQLTLGSWMSLENSGSTLKVHDSYSEPVAQALFQKRNYRAPFVVPEKV